MYERNAIVLERYFNQMFGYNMKNNIKTNFDDYCDLVECLEKYKDISDEEDIIMQEYDAIANKIRDVQKRQELLNKKNEKYQKEREEVFQNIDENVDTIQKKIDQVNNNIQSLDEQIRENANEFVGIVAEFNEKSNTRTVYGRSRRNIEGEYNTKLNKILDDYQNIDVDIERRAKQFIDMPTEDIEKELKENIEKNGKNEKIPFNMEVITKAISLSVDVQKRETEILANVYDKTSKLFTEIKNNSTKGDRHKKIIRDSKSKLEFVQALKEYLVLFLDNERLTAVNGQEEHEKLMKEACKNLDEDLVQINNLYTLLLKEISKKIAKKSYNELYNIQYLKDLEKKSEDFERQIKKLNLPVTIINPNYWRIEGMKKIYDVFSKNVTEEYGRDLSEYMPKEDVIVEEKPEDDWDVEEEKEPEIVEEPVKKKTTKRKIKNIAKEENPSSEIDKKIDMILGFDDSKKSIEKDDEWDEEDLDENQESEEVYYDIWGNDIKDNEKKKYDDDDDDWEEDDWDDDEFDSEDEEDDEEYDDEEEWNDEDEDDDDEYTDEEEYEDEWDDEEDDDWEDDEEDDWDDDEEKESPKVAKKNKKQDDDWGNEFINVEEKGKTKKKKGFFDKFKK